MTSCDCCDCSLLTDHFDFLDDLAAEALDDLAADESDRPPADERNRA